MATRTLSYRIGRGIMVTYGAALVVLAVGMFALLVVLVGMVAWDIYVHGRAWEAVESAAMAVGIMIAVLAPPAFGAWLMGGIMTPTTLRVAAAGVLFVGGAYFAMPVAFVFAALVLLDAARDR